MNVLKKFLLNIFAIPYAILFLLSVCFWPYDE